jgi:hypothetical protein
MNSIDGRSTHVDQPVIKVGLISNAYANVFMNTYLSFNFKFETVLVSNERRKTNSRHEESQASHTCGRFRDTVADEVMPWVATGRDVLARGGVTTAFNDGKVLTLPAIGHL